MPSTQMKAATTTAVMDGLLAQCRTALAAAEALHDSARSRIAATVSRNGKIDTHAFDAAQFAAHGFAWIATYVEALRQLGAQDGQKGRDVERRRRAARRHDHDHVRDACRVRSVGRQRHPQQQQRRGGAAPDHGGHRGAIQRRTSGP